MKNGMFGVMLGCSRNAVATVDTIKKYIDLLSGMGYNTLMLYTEDTYEIPEHPRFGYLRGRYSMDELKEIVAYGEQKGVELIPCIQTLAHLNQIFKWSEFQAHRDIDDILLIDDERTYTLIRNMFKTLREVFKTNRVHIGMDEAHNVGKGRYLDIHGPKNRFELISHHLKLVLEIAEEYDFKAMMWSDMFFRLVNNGRYDVTSPDMITEELAALVPENVELVYWDYYADNVEFYDKMLSAHERFNNKTIFAGGAWSWTGFTPHNGIAISRTEKALAACDMHNVKDVFLTIWGDDGNETSPFSILPTLFYTAQVYSGNTDMDSIKAKFKEFTGVAFDDYIKLDLPTQIFEGSDKRVDNIEKMMLFNDPLLGIDDSLAEAGSFAPAKYADYAKQLSAVEGGEYKYIFETLSALCELLSVKFDLGLKLRTAYKAKDTEGLKNSVADCEKAIELLDKFYEKFEYQWRRERKGNGFDIQDIRFGGLRQRLLATIRLVNKYLDGEIDSIGELEETILPHIRYYDNRWLNNASVSIIY